MSTITPARTIATLLTDDLRHQVEAALPAFLLRQRWFGGKSRAIRQVRFVSITALSPASALGIISIDFADGVADLYQLPLAILPHVPALSNALIATVDSEGAALHLYEATASPEFRRALLEAIVLPAKSADLRAHCAPSADTAALLAAPSRVGSAEQSNTSILFGEHAILKLFRRLTLGENPDVEVGRFLAAANFQSTPAYLGSLTAADGTTLAYLQAFAPNEGDGWAWFLAQLSRHFASRQEISDKPSVQAAALLGRRTAEIHAALATATTDVAFAAEPYTSATLAAEIVRITTQTQAALTALAAALPALSPELAAKATTLITSRDRISAHLDHLAGADPAQLGQRIRIHGDYHLGQLLRTPADFLIVDFEGEPARSLAERRTKQTPLKDVAGMLRSFNYVAQSARSAQPHAADLHHAATAWEHSVTEAFLGEYRATLSSDADVSPSRLLAASVQADALLRALLLEKASYELMYELNNRPAWLYLPLDGLLTLVDSLKTLY